jgi:hypothetical protein
MAKLLCRWESKRLLLIVHAATGSRNWAARHESPARGAAAKESGDPTQYSPAGCGGEPSPRPCVLFFMFIVVNRGAGMGAEGI